MVKNSFVAPEEDKRVPTQHPLLDVTEIDTDIEAYLKQIGETIYKFPE